VWREFPGLAAVKRSGIDQPNVRALARIAEPGIGAGVQLCWVKTVCVKGFVALLTIVLREKTVTVHF
jgi:hypothetical protein